MSEESKSVPPTKGPVPLAVKIVLVIIAISAIGFVYNMGQSKKEADAAKILSTLQAFNSAANEMINGPAAPADSDPMTDKSFRLESISFTDNGQFSSALGRVTNTSDRAKTAIFTVSIIESDGLTVFDNYTGSAEGVQPGQSVTVEFIGNISPPSGRFSYAFQVDMEY